LIQMVYDLIAIQSPEYFTQHHTQLIKRVIRNIDKNNFVTTISKSTKDDLCEYCGIESDRVFVTHLAASASFHPCSDQDLIARTRQQYGIPDGPYALSLCTLEPRKNIDHLIRCFRRLAREQAIPDLNLVLVGTRGWKFGRIMAEIEDSTDLGDRLITTGYVPDDDLAPLYSGAEMFVYPSLYEGFGLPPLEAMQCGVPVITSNTSSLPEVVGDAGRMVDPRDEDALCQAMLDIHRSQQLREALSGKSLAQAARFSWARCATQTEAAYRAVLDR